MILLLVGWHFCWTVVMVMCFSLPDDGPSNLVNSLTHSHTIDYLSSSKRLVFEVFGPFIAKSKENQKIFTNWISTVDFCCICVCVLLQLETKVWYWITKKIWHRMQSNWMERANIYKREARSIFARIYYKIRKYTNNKHSLTYKHTK